MYGLIRDYIAELGHSCDSCEAVRSQTVAVRLKDRILLCIYCLPCFEVALKERPIYITDMFKTDFMLLYEVRESS